MATVTELYRYRGGELAVYEVVEDAVPGYTTSYAAQTESTGGDISFTVTNKRTPAVNARTITKVWKDSRNAEGLRPAYVNVQLYKNGKAYGDLIRLDADNNWQAHVCLSAYEAGNKIEWTVVEVKIPRYYAVSYDQETLTIINSLQSKTVPKTGDYDEFLPWVIMFTGCIAGAVMLVACTKKKHKNK